jgi:hypothetical protein
MTNPKLAIAMTMAALLSAGLVTISAGAQNPSTPLPPPQQSRPVPPNGGSSSDPDQQSTNPTPNTLGSELSHSNGVIKPPSTGDQGVIPPPTNGTQSTPVIPPPGTPGGNPNVQPK